MSCVGVDASKVSNRVFSSLLQVEYQVESCSRENKDVNGCVDVKRTSVPMQTGGYVVYGVAHQHSGGIGSTLYGEVM